MMTVASIDYHHYVSLHEEHPGAASLIDNHGPELRATRHLAHLA